ncbi:MAG: LPS export ABC transporter periplasmic protein LptC, partial [Holophagales bacterium]|nr:LPS export ABC transporter periplasmic protein LptC [Holophagales bacterium]
MSDSPEATAARRRSASSGAGTRAGGQPVAGPPPRRALRRARSPFRWLRRLLLMVGVLGIAGLGVLLAAYRFGTETVLTEDGESRLEDQGAVTVSEQVEFVQTSGGEQVFRVRAERSIQERDGTRRLEGVTLDVPREDGTVWTIVSDRATLTGDDAHALLEGNVHISGWGDLTVTTRELEVLDRGNTLLAPGTVEFHYPPDLEGRASRMRVDKLSNTVYLEEGVHLHTVPGAPVPVRLDCQRLMYRRSEGLVRAVEDVYLQHGGQELRAHYLSLFLYEDQRSVKVVRARWNVEGALSSFDEAGGEIRASLRGQFLEVEPNAQDPELRQIDLEGTVEEPVFLRVSMPDGLGRTLEARKLQARARGGNLLKLGGFGDPLTMVEMIDVDPPYPLRHVCADTLDAGFLPGGELDQMVLRGQVEISDPTLHMSGG